jgi:hypothetical protein
MTPLFRLAGAVRDDPAVAAWFACGADELRHFAAPWFARMRACGPDVHELLHDGRPTACVADTAFAYVAAFTRHVNVGFCHGADLPDPGGLLAGGGKRMRHVKLRWGEPVDEAAIAVLIAAAYRDIRSRLQQGPFGEGG